MQILLLQIKFDQLKEAQAWWKEWFGNDFEYGSGYIKFKGTDTQLDSFLSELGKNQMYFKAIGVHTIK